MEATNNGQTFTYALPKASKSRLTSECRYNVEEFFKVNPTLRVTGYAAGESPDANWLTHHIEDQNRARSGRYMFLNMAGVQQLACRCFPQVWHNEAGGWGAGPNSNPAVNDAAIDAMWQTLDQHNGRLTTVETSLAQKADNADVRTLRDAYAAQDLRIDDLVKSRDNLVNSYAILSQSIADQAKATADLLTTLQTLVKDLDKKHQGLWWRIFGR